MDICPGDKYLCPSDEKTYEVIKVDKGELTVKCIDCLSKNPFIIEKKDFVKKVERGIFKKVSQGKKMEVVEETKEKMTIDKSKPLPKYIPQQNKSLFD